MLNRLKTTLTDRVVGLKIALQRCKVHFFICVGLVALAFLIALTEGYDDQSASPNFIAATLNGSYRPVGTFFKIACFGLLFYAAILLTSVNLIGYFGGYLALYFLAFYGFRTAFWAIACDGALGFLFFFIFVLPLLIVDFLFFVLLTAEIYQCASFRLCRTHLFRLTGRLKATFFRYLRAFLFLMLFHYLLWLTIYLICRLC